MAVRRIEPNGKWPDRWAVDSRSGGETHIVASRYVEVLSAHRLWACSCAKWKFAKAPKPHCHHIREVFDAIGLRTSPPHCQRCNAILTVHEQTHCRQCSEELRRVAAEITPEPQPPEPQVVTRPRRAIRFE